MEKINPREFFKSKSVLITGACGTIGSHLIKVLLECNLGKLRLLDIDDTALTELKDELENGQDAHILRFLIGDIKDKGRLLRAFEGIDYVFHCAALKHVAIGEYNPAEIIKTNITGTENVIEASLQNNVKKVIFTSSDKAVNPLNTMGASKLLGEKLMVTANYIRGSKNTIFSSVRFGNILGSRGSIIPRFMRRLQKGLHLTITDPNITRFMMPVTDAVDLTITALIHSKGGEIFVLKMPSLILKDLIELFTEYAWLKYRTHSKLEIIGLYPGEKTYEELMNEEEVARAVELPDMYVILPHIYELLTNYDKNILENMGKIHSRQYNSQHTTPLSKSKIEKILKRHNVFENSSI